MTTPEATLIYNGIIFAAFLGGIVLGALGMAVTFLRIMEQSSAKAVKAYTDALNKVVKIHEESKGIDKDGEDWLRHELGDK